MSNDARAFKGRRIIRRKKKAKSVYVVIPKNAKLVYAVKPFNLKTLILGCVWD
jgi:hypothetical protein